VELDRDLEVDQTYTMTTHFTGNLTRNMVGMYWSSYEEDGETKYDKSWDVILSR
jgi:hypothetical protein